MTSRHNYSRFLLVAYHPKRGLCRDHAMCADSGHAATTAKWAFIARHGYEPTHVYTIQCRFSRA